MAVETKPGPPSAETWQASDLPHQLVGWGRRVGNARRYLLLASAVARYGLKAADTDAGRRVVECVEGLAGRPKAGRGGRLVEDYLRPAFPGWFQAGPPYLSEAGRRALGLDRGPDWVSVLARFAARPNQAGKAVANVMIERAMVHLRAAAGTAAAAEIAEVRRAIAARPRKGFGRFGPLLGWARGVYPGPSQAAVTAAVLARIPADRRPAVPPGLPAYSLGWWTQHALYPYRAQERRERVCDLVREVFGDPFRPWRLPPGWAEANAESAVGVARHIDATGEYGVLPVLADALEDAGVDDPAVIGHCRGPGPHVPGCWVVDAVLGR